MNDFVPIEDTFDAKLVGDAKSPPAEETYDQIPERFMTLADWPQKTNLRCWNSNFRFDCVPKFVPTSMIEDEDGNIVFGVKGNFMSFRDAASYIETKTAPEQRAAQRAWLARVYLIFTGVKVSQVPPAPDITKTREYGGAMEPEEYLKTVQEFDNPAKSKTPQKKAPLTLQDLVG
jgi:hypothetical protein